MAEWYVDRYNTMNVFIECPKCGKGFRGTVLDPIPDKCPDCGSENEGNPPEAIRLHHAPQRPGWFRLQRSY